MRVKKETDRRAYSLKLTDKADKIKEEVYLIMNEWESKIASCFDKEESKNLMELLRKLANSSLFNKENINE